ncbi:MAG TPA: glycoside hydrolase family 16 protein [Verrucomicrobiota bacterium]|nr:glycoside hydrolase family 16 protein [Verrucomicrobiota bacterium]
MPTSRFPIFLISWLTVALLLPTGAADSSLPGWKLIWADEFNQADGTAPAPARWVFDLGGGGWGNNELQTYTSRRENSRIERGQLVIEALREKFNGTDGKPRDFTSARLKTLGKFAFTYGRVEARIKVPRGQGIWPAFWMMGTNAATAGWPSCGEIDVLENIGREPTTVHGTVHGPGYSGAKGIGEKYQLPDGAAFADDFHVFSLEWSKDSLRWFVDGNAFFEVTPAKLPAGAKWVFDHPQFLLLNLAVGGNWPGAPNANTQLPQRLSVDYVRVYRRADEAGNP